MQTDSEEVNGYMCKLLIAQDSFKKYICTVAFIRTVDKGKPSAPENRRKIIEMFDTEADAVLAGKAFGQHCAENHETGIP